MKDKSSKKTHTRIPPMSIRPLAVTIPFLLLYQNNWTKWKLKRKEKKKWLKLFPFISFQSNCFMVFDERKKISKSNICCLQAPIINHDNRILHLKLHIFKIWNEHLWIDLWTPQNMECSRPMTNNKTLSFSFFFTCYISSLWYFDSTFYFYSLQQTFEYWTSLNHY